ncbi:hypothetical protein COMA2_190049 [Candidatus Nitrospira nitrificans]|uniref:Uncharacterized protein n=1 Tax=Candidatus Nitrospira nitrificans TaxID=1742973 RepID=A0A0S4LBC5_9BACT|nr:hypothetical protein COMA2_190049 [Candidatus Nitrospira nitrificans]
MREIGVLSRHIVSLWVVVSVASRSLGEAKKVLTPEVHKESYYADNNATYYQWSE